MWAGMTLFRLEGFPELDPEVLPLLEDGTTLERFGDEEHGEEDGPADFPFSATSSPPEQEAYHTTSDSETNQFVLENLNAKNFESDHLTAILRKMFGEKGERMLRWRARRFFWLLHSREQRRSRSFDRRVSLSPPVTQRLFPTSTSSKNLDFVRTHLQPRRGLCPRTRTSTRDLRLCHLLLDVQRRWRDMGASVISQDAR